MESWGLGFRVWEDVIMGFLAGCGLSGGLGFKVCSL